MAFPQTRLRRLRRTGALRDLVRETDLAPRHLIQPLFVALAQDAPRAPIDAMPGVDRLSISAAAEEARALHDRGIPGVLLFGLPADKDEEGSGAWDDEGVVQLATRAIKDACPDVLVIADVCLCEYTSHGHCGLLRSDGAVDNDATLELLSRTAVSQANAGADMVAPSDMMDGRVGHMRAELDDHGLTDTPSWPTAPRWPAPSTGRSARRPTRPRRSATAAPTRWTAPTPTRPCARRCSTSTRAPTWSWSSPRCRTSTWCAGSRTLPACRWPPTTSAASTRCSRRPRRPATWTSAPPRSRR